MFLKLHWAYTKDEVVFNVGSIVRVSRSAEDRPTIVKTVDGSEELIHETPGEILEQIQGKSE